MLSRVIDKTLRFVEGLQKTYLSESTSGYSRGTTNSFNEAVLWEDEVVVAEHDDYNFVFT